MVRIVSIRRVLVLILLVLSLVILSELIKIIPSNQPISLKPHKKEVKVIGDEESKDFQAPLSAVLRGDMVYIADGPAAEIKVFSIDGEPQSQFGGGKFHDAKGSKLKYPTALAWGPSGELYVADSIGGKIVAFTIEGKGKRVIRLREDKKTRLSPLAITFDEDGNLYIADGKVGKVLVYDSDDRFVREFAVGKLDHPNGLVVDADGRVFIGDSNNGRILIYDKRGYPERELRVTDKKSFLPRGIAFDHKGRLVVADVLNSRILFLDKLGNKKKQLMSLPNMETLFLPTGISVTGDRLIIADRGLGQVFIIQVP